MEQLKDALKQAKLTKTSKLIGDYILDHETDACFMTSTELATELDISEASVIRFGPGRWALRDIWIFKRISADPTRSGLTGSPALWQCPMSGFRPVWRWRVATIFRSSS